MERARETHFLPSRFGREGANLGPSHLRFEPLLKPRLLQLLQVDERPERTMNGNATLPFLKSNSAGGEEPALAAAREVRGHPIRLDLRSLPGKNLAQPLQILMGLFEHFRYPFTAAVVD